VINMATEPRPSNPDDLEVISAFIDGERVDPDALRTALALADGRDYLVDLLTLREAIADAGPPPASARLPARQVRGIIRPMAAAAVALLALAGGFAAGQRVSLTKPSAPDADLPHMVVTSSAPAAPRPTRVIKLEPGRNWTEQTGGH